MLANKFVRAQKKVFYLQEELKKATLAEESARKKYTHLWKDVFFPSSWKGDSRKS
jgi:hypothetical protein